MKVEVLTVKDVEIKKWHWWSNWIDIAVFQHGYSGYLLQMRIGRSNVKKFRVARMAGMDAECCMHDAGDLTHMKKGG